LGELTKLQGRNLQSVPHQKLEEMSHALADLEKNISIAVENEQFNIKRV
jgi:hypothetical protein